MYWHCLGITTCYRRHQQYQIICIPRLTALLWDCSAPVHTLFLLCSHTPVHALFLLCSTPIHQYTLCSCFVPHPYTSTRSVLALFQTIHQYTLCSCFVPDHTPVHVLFLLCSRPYTSTHSVLALFQIHIPVPPNTSDVKLSHLKGRAKYKTSENSIVWK